MAKKKTVVGVTDAAPDIQEAIDTVAAEGGGTELPPGEMKTEEVVELPASVELEGFVTPPAEPTMDDVMRDLAEDGGTAIGYCALISDAPLTGEQAQTQIRIFAALARRGKIFARQGQVYGWLLDQISKSLPETVA